MDIFLTALYIIFGLAVFCAVGLALWAVLSPMPAVLLLRRGKDAPPEYPLNYEQMKQNVTTVRNLEYPSSYSKNELDLYLPKNAQNLTPVIIWVHGGAFIGGDKIGVSNWATSLAAEGAAVAAINYEWAPKASWPAQIIQICDCCKYLQKISQEYNIDMSRVVIAGDSAGAHMAAQFALLHTNAEFCTAAGLSAILQKGALKATLLYCGPYDITQMARPKKRIMRFFMSRIGWSYLGKRNWQRSEKAKLTVIKSFVTPNFPPSYITDGNAYSFENQGRELVKELYQKGVLVNSRFFDKENGEVTHEYQFSMQTDNAIKCYTDTINHLKQIKLL